MLYDFCGFACGRCRNQAEDIELPSAAEAIDYAKHLLEKWEDSSVEVSRRIVPHGDWPIASVFRDGDVILP